MVDRLTPEQRHKNMQRIKNKNSDIETILRKELWTRGLHYRKNAKTIYGHPDIVFIKRKIAVFCDSEFWHGYNWTIKKKDFQTNKDFWTKKIERNIARDIEVNNHLESDGWTVLRFWGNDIKKHTSECADIVEKAFKG